MTTDTERLAKATQLLEQVKFAFELMLDHAQCPSFIETVNENIRQLDEFLKSG